MKRKHENEGLTPRTLVVWDRPSSSAPRIVTCLVNDWKFRQADHPEAEFRITSGFPTEIFKDLLFHGLIPDPFVAKNENNVQWVGEKAWSYRTTFPSPSTLHENTAIVFEGLDTYATVKLNGEIILESSNAFTPYRVDVGGKLHSTTDNTLEITFESALLVGKKKLETKPDHFWGCWNGDPSRLAVRKPQYHYGWDWGPTLLTCGPWKPIYIETFTSRISDLSFRTHIEDSLKSAQIIAKCEFNGPVDRVKFELSIDGTLLLSTDQICDFSEMSFRTEHPQLWYPRGYGQQHLYTLTATIFHGGTLLDTSSKVFGLRKVKLVQNELKDAPGTSFFFEINNIPIFCGGSNWIPAHSFQTMLNPQKYRDWIEMVAEGNQIMLRVWGGGIYEHDTFYEECDKKGILVWHDFMFACGNYPADRDFLDSVKQEAIANVKRLRHHPCIVIWAGNNEDYQYRETTNLEYDPKDHDPEHWLKTSFPARYIYEKLLLEVTQELVPDTYYHFGSPYGGKNTADVTIGDIHQWNIWHGSQEKYQNCDKLVGRFISEFGMEAYPDVRTLDGILEHGSKDIDRYSQSSTIEFHNKAEGHERRLALYLAENITYSMKPLEEYVYNTQLIQSETISAAFRSWKRQWKGPSREYCGGALFWQMNDCWPVISWSIVDHYLRPKLGYFALKREMQPLTIGMKRTKRTRYSDQSHQASVETVQEVEIWACNLSLQEYTLNFEIITSKLKVIQTADGPQVEVAQKTEDDYCQKVKILPNRSTEVTKFVLSASDNSEDANQTVVSASLCSDSPRRRLAEAINWPEPLKHVHLPKPKYLYLRLGRFRRTALEATRYRPVPDWYDDSDTACSVLELNSDVPLKGVKLGKEDDSDGEGLISEDQGFDVSGTNSVHLCLRGIGVGEEKKLRVRYLGM